MTILHRAPMALRGISARRPIRRLLEVLSWAVALLLTLRVILAWGGPSASDASTDTWPYYGHDAGGMRYSPLTQINRDNVAQLRVA